MKEFCLPDAQFNQIGVMMANQLAFPVANPTVANQLGTDEEIVYVTCGEHGFLATAKQFSMPWAMGKPEHADVLFTTRTPMRLWLRKD